MNDAIKLLSCGDEVYWNDPDNGICSGYFTVAAIYSDSGEVENEDTILALTDGLSEVDAFASEIDLWQL